MPATKAFFNQNGVTVTNTALTTPKGSFKFDRIRHVRLASWTTGLLFWRRTIWRLTEILSSVSSVR